MCYFTGCSHRKLYLRSVGSTNKIDRPTFRIKIIFCLKLRNSMLLAPLSSNFFRKSRNLYLPPTVLNTIKPFIGKCAFLFGHIRQDQEHNQHTIFHIKSKVVTHSSATGNNKSETIHILMP